MPSKKTKTTKVVNPDQGHSFYALLRRRLSPAEIEMVRSWGNSTVESGLHNDIREAGRVFISAMECRKSYRGIASETDTTPERVRLIHETYRQHGLLEWQRLVDPDKYSGGVGILALTNGSGRAEAAALEDAKIGEFLAYIESGQDRDTAADLAQIPRETIRKLLDSSLEFTKDVLRAEGRARDDVVKRLKQRAEGMTLRTVRRKHGIDRGAPVDYTEEIEKEIPPDTAAAKLFLETRDKSFQQSKGAGKAPRIEIKISGMKLELGSRDDEAIGEVMRLADMARKGITHDNTKVIDAHTEPEPLPIDDEDDHQPQHHHRT